MSDPKDKILEELSYTNLTTAALAARLKMTQAQIRPFLKSLEEAKVLRQIEWDGDKVWELT